MKIYSQMVLRVLNITNIGTSFSKIRGKDYKNNKKLIGKMVFERILVGE